jgi:phosphoribosylformylglycinamidine (FGAM) synthase PurS component
MLASGTVKVIVLLEPGIKTDKGQTNQSVLNQLGFEITNPEINGTQYIESRIHKSWD